MCFLEFSAFFVSTFFFSSRRRDTSLVSDWSADVCSSDLVGGAIETAKLALEHGLACNTAGGTHRSEERRVGKACRSRGSPNH